MKNKLIALALATAMGLSLVACGSAAPAASADPAAPAEEKTEAAAEASGDKVELNVIAAQYGNNTQAWWAGFVEDFNADNPDINLTVDVVSWNDIYTTVNTRLQNNQAPDILNIDVFADYQADDLLLPAKDYISDETYAKFFPAFLSQSVVDGTVWAVPDLASARALFVNMDILKAAGVDKAPTTWDELTAACEAIKAYDPDIYPWGVDMTTDEGQACFAYYVWNNGGDFTDEDGNWTLNSDENVEAIEYIIDLYNKGLTNNDPANQTRYDLQDLFGAGQLAMVIAPNQLPTYLSDGGYDVNFEIVSIPTNTTESASAGVMDRFMCFDNDYSAAELAAVTTFFDYFYEDARYSEWVLMEGFLPATSAGSAAMAAADPSQKAWIDIVGGAKFYPTAKAEWADVKQGVIDVEQNALLGGNVKELLDDLQAEIAGN